jgi:hypothetical protein
MVLKSQGSVPRDLTTALHPIHSGNFSRLQKLFPQKDLPNMSIPEFQTCLLDSKIDQELLDINEMIESISLGIKLLQQVQTYVSTNIQHEAGFTEGLLKALCVSQESQANDSDERASDQLNNVEEDSKDSEDKFATQTTKNEEDQEEEEHVELQLSVEPDDLEESEPDHESEAHVQVSIEPDDLEELDAVQQSKEQEVEVEVFGENLDAVETEPEDDYTGKLFKNGLVSLAAFQCVSADHMRKLQIALHEHFQVANKLSVSLRDLRNKLLAILRSIQAPASLGAKEADVLTHTIQLMRQEELQGRGVHPNHRALRAEATRSSQSLSSINLRNELEHAFGDIALLRNELQSYKDHLQRSHVPFLVQSWCTGSEPRHTHSSAALASLQESNREFHSFRLQYEYSISEIANVLLLIRDACSDSIDSTHATWTRVEQMFRGDDLYLLEDMIQNQNGASCTPK